MSSSSLKVWQQPQDAPTPTTLEEAIQVVDALQLTEPGINPDFVTVAHKLVKKFPVDDEDSVWLSDPRDQSVLFRGGVWVLDLPDDPDQRAHLMRCVVDESTARGLTVMAEELGMVFLPSGQVLPPSDQAGWDDLKQQMDTAAQTQEKPITKADLRKMMVTFLHDILEKHGFVGKKMPDGVTSFTRSFEGGEQEISMWIKGNAPNFTCEISCESTNQLIKNLLATVYGERHNVALRDVSFSVGIFKGYFNSGHPITSSQEVKSLLSLLETKALPLLDLARNLDGVDQIFHNKNMVPLDYKPLNPNSPVTLSDSMNRSRAPVGIAVAWLASNPEFESIAQAAGEAMKVTVHAHQYDELMAYLRAHESSRPKVKTLQ
ncbi:MAG: hypothetical protein RIS44_2579 [Pseudomonadota bacterium]|jgi:hypothetical protein